MTESVGRIDLDLGLNYGAFNKQLGGIANNAESKVGGAFKKLGLIIAGAFAVGAVVAFGKTSIGLASDLNEVQNVVDVTFGAMSGSIDNFAKNALNQFGLSELSAKKFASTMGAMLKSSGLSGKGIVDMSKSLTGLSADFASFYNLNNNDAFDKIRSGISGETEPLKQLGINMSVANLDAFALSIGIRKSTAAMTQAEIVMLRYKYLMSVSKDAQGDFARTSTSWANQTRLLSEQWKIFQGTMGQGFINILTPIVHWLNSIILRLQLAAQYFRAFTEAIFGSANSTAAGAATATVASNAMKGLGGSTNDAAAAVTKAGKAAKASLGSFDQLNVLTKSTAGAMGGMADNLNIGSTPDSASSTPKVDTGKFTAEIKDMIIKAKGSFNTFFGDIKTGWALMAAEFGPTLSTAWNKVSPELEKWKMSFNKVFGDVITLGQPLKNFVINDLFPYWNFGIALLGDVVSGLSGSVRTAFNDLWAAAFPIIDNFVTLGLPRLAEFGIGMLTIFQSTFDLVKLMFDNLWQGVAQPALMLLSKVTQDSLNMIYGFWDKWGKDIVTGVTTALAGIKQLWTDLWETFLKPFVDNMLKMLNWLWEKHLKDLVQHVLDFVGKLVESALEILNKFILPIVDFLVKQLGPTFSNIFSGISDVVGTAIGLVADVLSGLFTSLGGVVDFITGVFTLNWGKAWGGIVLIFKGIGESLAGIFKGAVNLIVDALNFFIRQANKLKIDIPDWMAGLVGMKGGTFGLNIPEIPKLAAGGLVHAPMLAMVGDNKNASSDPEVVSPLSKLQGMMGGGSQEMVDVLKLILKALQDMNAPLVLHIGETEIGRTVIKAINNLQRQAGTSLLIS